MWLIQSKFKVIFDIFFRVGILQNEGILHEHCLLALHNLKNKEAGLRTLFKNKEKKVTLALNMQLLLYPMYEAGTPIIKQDKVLSLFSPSLDHQLYEITRTIRGTVRARVRVR